MNQVFRGFFVSFALLGAVASQGYTLQLGWQRVLPSSGHSAFASAGAQDASENFYLASRQPGAGGDTTVITKFDNYGGTVWSRSFPWNTTVFPQTVTTDNFGHVIVTLQKTTGLGKTEVDLLDFNSTTGVGVFSRAFTAPSQISTIACGIQPSTHNIELCLSVAPTMAPYVNFARDVILSPAGNVLKTVDDLDISPERCIFDPYGNMAEWGKVRLNVFGSSIARKRAAGSLSQLWQFQVNGVYIPATKTQYTYGLSLAFDDTNDNLYLAEERSKQVNGGLPTVQSVVYGFNPAGTRILTGAVTPTAVFGISANGGLIVTGAGTDGTYLHTVLTKVGANSFTVQKDGLRDFCCHDTELYYVDADTTGFNFGAFDATGWALYNPIHFKSPGTGAPFGGSLISQPNSFGVIGSFDQGGGVYNPCCEVFRDGIRFSGVQIPATFVSGATIPVTVQCNGPAPAGGIQVNLSSPQLNILNRMVMIPAGMLSAMTTATAPPTATNEAVTVIGKGSGVYRADTATDTGAKLTKAVASDPVVGGNPIPVTITLSGKAPAGGLLITITSNDTTAVASNQTITVAEGDAEVTSFIDSKVVNSNHTVKLTYKDPSGTTLTQTITISK